MPTASYPITAMAILSVPERASSRYYPALQGLRGFSALAVFLVHIYRMAMNGDFLPPLPGIVHAAWSTLGTGVGLFFMISGFVIPASLARHGDLRRFFTDRVLRIMPLFVLVHLAVFSVGPLVGYKWLAEIAPGRYAELFFANLTFTALPLGLPLLQQNSWSLSYEWAFYIALGAGWQWRRSSAGGIVIDALLLLAAAVACFAFPECLYFAAGYLLYHLQLPMPRRPARELPVAFACLAAYLALAQFTSPFLAVVPATVLFACCLGQGVTARFFSHQAMMWLGKISFSLYLLHPLLMFPLQSALRRLALHGFDKVALFALFAAAATLIVLPISWLSHELIEVRLRAALHARLERTGRSEALRTVRLVAEDR